MFSIILSTSLILDDEAPTRIPFRLFILKISLTLVLVTDPPYRIFGLVLYLFCRYLEVNAITSYILLILGNVPVPTAYIGS